MARLGDHEGARSYHEQSLAIHKDLGNQRGMANSLFNLGNVYFEQGDAAGARSLFEQSLAIARELKDDWYAAYSLVCLADVLKAEGHYGEARSLAQRSLSIVRNIGDKFAVATALAVLGEIACAEREVELARSLFTECMAVRRELGQKQGIAEALEDFARLAIAIMESDAGSAATFGHAVRTARLLGAAGSLRKGLGAPLQPTVLANQRAQLSTIHAVLEDEKFNAAWEAGQAMELEQAIEYALEMHENQRTAGPESG